MDFGGDDFDVLGEDLESSQQEFAAAADEKSSSVYQASLRQLWRHQVITFQAKYLGNGWR